MRLVSHRRAFGVTLIELLVVLSILGILAVTGLPALQTFIANSRIREAANVVVATAVLARNEAIKRNATVTLRASPDGTSLAMTFVSGGAVTPIGQAVPLTGGARVAVFSAAFEPSGRLSPFPNAVEIRAAVDAGASLLCGGDIVCPVVRMEAGGAVNLCVTGTCS